MARLRFAALFIGAIIVYFGFQEYKVSRGTTPEPQKVDLAKLEAGEWPENNHILIGEHAAFYDFVVCVCKEGKRSMGDKAPLEYAYYPIFSLKAPGIANLLALKKRYGSLEKVPEEELSPFGDFTVLVKTRRFKTVSHLPKTSIRKEDSVKGLVINRIRKLNPEESDLIRGTFTEIDLDKVLILEHNRRPASPLKSWGLMLLGAVLLVWSLAGLFIPRKARRRSARRRTRTRQ